MARGEGETALKSHFVERVVKLPMFHVVLDYASNTYAHIKESNKLVNFTLTNAEKTATFVAGQAKPVVLKFEKQIQAVDDLACKGLGTLEEKVPFITKPTDEIIGDTRKYYESTVNTRLENIKKYSNDRVRSAADLSLKGANAILGENLVKSFFTTVDGFLVVTQNYVDYILPPTKDEKKRDNSKKDNEEPSSLTRLTQISSTVRHRFYNTLVLKWEYAQERSLELILTYPLQMIEITKTQVDTVVEFLTNILASLRRDTDENTTEKSQAPVALSAAKDGVMWVLGMISLVPKLLPMYIYGLVSWIEQQRQSKSDAEKEDIKANGVNSNTHSNNHPKSEDRNGQ